MARAANHNPAGSGSLWKFVLRLLDGWDERAIRREIRRSDASDIGARIDLHDLLRQEGLDD